MTAQEYVDASVARKTTHSAASLWKHWARWCESRRYPDMPADPDCAMEYLAERMRAGDRPGTAQLRLWAIGYRHREEGMENPLAVPAMRKFMHGLLRTHGSERKQAPAITAEVLHKLRQKCWHDKKTLAIICLMRDAMLRREEAARLRWKDLTEAEDGSGRLLIRRSKTDQTGKGHVAYISSATMAAVYEGLDRGADDDLLVGLKAQAINKRIRIICEKAELPGTWSSHGCRVGMAQDLAAAGASMAELMQAGRWKTNAMPATYVRNQTAERNAVALLYRNRLGGEMGQRDVFRVMEVAA